MLIHNANLITWGAENRLLEEHAVFIEDGRTAELGLSSDLLAKYPDAEKLDAGGGYLLPGNICAHTHFYGAYARGLAIPGDPPADFPQILRKLWWPLDKALDADSVRASALVHLVDAVRNGTTTLIDHHASPNFIEGSLDVIAEAVDASGLRAVLCYEVSDRDGKEKAQAGIQENVRFLNAAAQGQLADGRVAASFGLHASMTLSDETLAACRQAAEDSGFHIHVAEHEADQQDSLEKYNMRVVPRLAQQGILGERSIIAHAIHIEDEEIDLLAESGSWVTHQPRSNMNNGVGVAAVEKLLAAGIPVCLGNDGFTQDMWAEWKTAYLLHKVDQLDPQAMNGMDVVRMAVDNNAALAGTFFPESQLGQIAVGAAADLMLVDYHGHTPLSAGNAPWHILFGFEERMVRMTMVAGEILMRDGELLTLDEEKIAAEARALAPQVWARYEQFAGE